MRLPPWLAQHLAALRAMLMFTVVLGLAYPLAITAVAQLPGLQSRAHGSLLTGPASSTPAGSRLIGQAFLDKDGNALVQYFQSRPSAAGDGYDPTSTSASNLGPEDIVFFSLVASGPSGERVLASQLTPLRKAAGIAPLTLELAGVASRLRMGESLVLRITTHEQQFVQNGARAPFQAALAALVLELPLH